MPTPKPTPPQLRALEHVSAHGGDFPGRLAFDNCERHGWIERYETRTGKPGVLEFVIYRAKLTDAGRAVLISARPKKPRPTWDELRARVVGE